jgi:tetratricopeptide (TPR) repeat protein
MNTVGERLKQARTAQGLTQERLAEGVATKGFISQVERNLTTPSLPRLRLLAERLGLPLSYFVEGPAARHSGYLLKAAELAIRANEERRALGLLDEIDVGDLTANERADAWRIRGLALFGVGRRGQAVRTLQEAAAMAPADDPDLSAAIYAEIGFALGEQERFNASVEANLRALRALDSSRHPDLDLKARVLTNIANDWYRLGEIAQAVTYFEQALAVAMDTENLRRIANAHMALGVTCRATGQLDEAIRHCNRALALQRRLGQERLANQILNNLGDVYYSQGNIAEARRLQQQCLERGRQTKEYVAVSAAATELARYAIADGAFRLAVDLSTEARVAADKAHNDVFRARALTLHGLAADGEGRPAAADRAFRQAFQILQARDAQVELAEACARYSDLLRTRNDGEGALAFMRMAYARDFARLWNVLRAARGRAAVRRRSAEPA